MNAVIEVSVVRKIVNSDPCDGRACTKARPNWFEVRTVCPNLLVAAHTRFSGWHARGSGSFYRRMAVTAVNAIVADVVFMTKLNRLLALDPLPCVPGGAIELSHHPERCKQNEDSAKNAQLGQRVGAVMEDLWHRRRFANP